MTEPADDQARLRGYVDVWWQAVNDFPALLEELPAEAVGDADRPARLGRARRRRAHRAPRGASSPARPRRPLEVGEAGHVTRADGHLHRVGRRRPARPHARRAHQRDPGGGHLAAHRPARRPAHRRLGRARAGSSAASRGPGRRCCATARSTCGCTSRTSAARSAAPAAWTPPAARARRRLPRREPRPACSPSGSARAARHHRRARGRAAARPRRSGSPTPAAASGCRSVPADPTVALAMDRETFVLLAGGRRRPLDGAVRVTGDRELGHRLLDHLVSPVSRATIRRARAPAPQHPWRPADIPDQSGRTALVTGTTVGGLGHHTALELARRGARVVLAGRSAGPPRRDRTPRSAARCRAPRWSSSCSTSPTSAPYAARPGAAAALGPIDVLVNNAGVMATAVPPHRRRPRAADGDQPLRAVPAHRAAAAAAGRRPRPAGS